MVKDFMFGMFWWFESSIMLLVVWVLKIRLKLLLRIIKNENNRDVIKILFYYFKLVGGKVIRFSCM